jgi:MFS transporter, DHA2 family, multidrug resistance protein
MGERAGWREWAGLAVLALAVLLVSIDLFVLLMAVPRLSADLHASRVQQLWIVDIYGFMVAGFLITMGTVGDRIGRRRLLLAGAAAFGIASVLTAYSASPAMLIAARALLGIAGATLTPSTLALIASLFRDQRQRATAIGIWGTCFSAGAIIGPAVGGAMLDHFWWGSVFLIGVPVMVALLALGPFLLPEHRDAAAGRVDLASVMLSLAAILPFVYGLKELAGGGWHPGPVLAVAAGVAVGALFARRQRTLANPLLDLRLFGERALTVTLAGMLMYSLLAGGTMTFLAQHFQLVNGLSPLGAGLAMVPGMASSIVSFQLAALLGRRIRPARLFPAGLAITLAGMIMITQSVGTAALATAFAIACFGTGPLVSLGTNLVVSSVPPRKAGAAAGLAQTCNECGLPLGVALLGSAGLLAYRADLRAHPAGLPQVAAQHAFTTELHVIAAIAAIGLAGTAIMLAAGLRHLPALGHPEPGPGLADSRTAGTGAGPKGYRDLADELPPGG